MRGGAGGDEGAGIGRVRMCRSRRGTDLTAVYPALFILFLVPMKRDYESTVTRGPLAFHVLLLFLETVSLLSSLPVSPPTTNSSYSQFIFSPSISSIISFLHAPPAPDQGPSPYHLRKHLSSKVMASHCGLEKQRIRM